MYQQLYLEIGRTFCCRCVTLPASRPLDAVCPDGWTVGVAACNQLNLACRQADLNQLTEMLQPSPCCACTSPDAPLPGQ